jgi:hypothetical protein
MTTYDPRPDPAAPPSPPSQVNVNQGTGTARYGRPSALTQVRRVVGLLFGVVVTLIAIRFILLMLGANSGNALVDGIYSFTEIFVAPFRGVFSIDQVSPIGTSVIDFGALVAIVAWSLIALLVIAILRIPDRGYEP